MMTVPFLGILGATISVKYVCIHMTMKYKYERNKFLMCYSIKGNCFIIHTFIEPSLDGYYRITIHSTHKSFDTRFCIFPIQFCVLILE